MERGTPYSVPLFCLRPAVTNTRAGASDAVKACWHDLKHGVEGVDKGAKLNVVGLMEKLGAQDSPDTGHEQKNDKTVQDWDERGHQGVDDPV